MLLPTIGELSFPILMQRYFIIPPTRSLPAVVWFRVLDLYTILLLAVLSLMLHQDSWWLAGLVIALLTLAIPVVYRWSPTSIAYFERHYTGRFKEKLRKVCEALPSSWRVLWLSSWWTLANWAVKLTVFAWIVQQFILVDFSQGLLGAIGGELTSVTSCQRHCRGRNL